VLVLLAAHFSLLTKTFYGIQRTAPYSVIAAGNVSTPANNKFRTAARGDPKCFASIVPASPGGALIVAIARMRVLTRAAPRSREKC
jgi:hypothetical protein